MRAIVLFPPAVELAQVAPLRQRFDPLAILVPPHVTLVFPFKDNMSAEALRAQVEEAVTGVGPISVRLAGVTGSESEYLFLNVKRGNDALIDLHDRLYNGPLRRHLSPVHTYVPHMTVGRLADRAAFRQALAVVSAANLCIETICDAVSICHIRRDRSVVVESEVPLALP